MASKHFELVLALRIILLVISISITVLLYSTTSFYFTASLLVILVIFQVWGLYYFLQKVVRKISLFFMAVKTSEFNHTFQTEKEGLLFSELNQTLNELFQSLATLRKNNQEQVYFYHNLIQHIAIGILAYRLDNSILIINNLAGKLLGCGNIANMEVLEKKSPAIFNEITQLESGKRKLIKVITDNEIQSISLAARIIKQDDGIVKIVAIQNIHSEMEEQEMLAWQKLISVLTHEIMNSVTPLVSLSETLKEITLGESLNKDQMSDLRLAIETINRRSKGLISFVETYRSLAKIPTPNFTPIVVEEFYRRIGNLFQNECNEKGISLQTNLLSPELTFMGDELMLEQVFINLVRNSMQALSDTQNPKILLEGIANPQGTVQLCILDNGHGILPEVLDKVFIPFFSTRQGGSGIGLALSRQMIKALGGTISIASKPGETKVTITF